ncbi:autotransporter outer membrane beta-barrel domain-containing protein [Gemmatimonas groenlandica]|uniref:Autotransporter outer membrane beta-barrel domain-containing protein n=1 Tax=Gemmatimonas groenlandica TaxID=2732249 RepID=A0A6M4IQM0_9BACT|nr:autotransporter outer membrane beta-barrel domain-containing protein [Gemmatimonas groenlandica]QJR36059.1 autotransporter outer membrane beta-barrel domain-containing protein [Gemmatimonas groenlandica]
MMTLRTTVAFTLGAFVAAFTVTERADAQASNYPSMQLPTASTRDYTAAVSSGAGTTALFQWREGWQPRRHWQLDAGLTDRKGSDNLALFVGGGIGQEIARARGDQPLDLLFTAGAGAAFGGGYTLVRIPVGVSIGHTFDLEQGMAITPYVHPRASVDIASSGGRNGGSQSEVSLNFDLGVNFQVNSQFAVRAAAAFTGSELAGSQDTFAIGFNWMPAPLARR